MRTLLWLLLSGLPLSLAADQCADTLRETQPEKMAAIEKNRAELGQLQDPVARKAKLREITKTLQAIDERVQAACPAIKVEREAQKAARKKRWEEKKKGIRENRLNRDPHPIPNHLPKPKIESNVPDGPSAIEESLKDAE